MYISKVVIENYRCFGSKTEIKLKPGVNVFIGENNSGKTTVLNALGFLFDRRGRFQLGIDDFNKNVFLYHILFVLAVRILSVKTHDRRK